MTSACTSSGCKPCAASLATKPTILRASPRARPSALRSLKCETRAELLGGCHAAAIALQHGGGLAALAFAARLVRMTHGGGPDHRVRHAARAARDLGGSRLKPETTRATDLPSGAVFRSVTAHLQGLATDARASTHHVSSAACAVGIRPVRR